MQPLRRARPVAEAPVDALVARADELARRWAIALVLARPLEQIGEVPLEDLAREAPALCEQAVRALQSDAELERMAAPAMAGGPEDSPPALRLGALAGVRDPGAVVQAVEALRGILWDALLDELRPPPSAVPAIFERSPLREVADLADRLAFVCATALAANLAQQPALALDHDTVPTARARVRNDFERSAAGTGKAVLVDEREDLPAPPRARSRVSGPGRAPSLPPRAAQPRSASAPRSDERRTQAHPRPWDTPLRANRGQGQPPETVIEGSGDEGNGPAMRITRRPSAPSDGPG
jgi:hypothetical protein